jgi:hypothetical protein
LRFGAIINFDIIEKYIYEYISKKSHPSIYLFVNTYILFEYRIKEEQKEAWRIDGIDFKIDSKFKKGIW